MEDRVEISRIVFDELVRVLLELRVRQDIEEVLAVSGADELAETPVQVSAQRLVQAICALHREGGEEMLKQLPDETLLGPARRLAEWHAGELVAFTALQFALDHPAAADDLLSQLGREERIQVRARAERLVSEVAADEG